MHVLSFLLLLVACSDKAAPLDTERVEGDVDGDGLTESAGDCDDADALIYAGAPEICDGLDNDCDGAIDEDVSTTFYVDTDGDGHGDDDSAVVACLAPEGTIPVGGDCDDTDGDVYPLAVEVCDGIDNDCDGLVDDDDDSLSLSSREAFYTDGDGDGYGDDEAVVMACEAPAELIVVGGDCDDTRDDFYPGAPEDDCTDPADYNCDGSVGYADADSDGFAACEECDDTDSSISPDAQEVCDGVDNDCDADIDDADDSVDTATGATFYADSDGDGYGSLDGAVESCEAPSGAVENATDCDDTDSSISPDAEEVCDEVDNDCDSFVDTNAIDAPTWYRDVDSDGYGNASVTVSDCDEPPGYVSDDTDCDDSISVINPGASEVCDGVDNDCDGTTDIDAIDAPTWYSDSDSDGYGTSTSSLVECGQPSGYVSDDTDCDDTDGSIRPDAEEVCDGVDNDCDSTTDIDAIDASTWYSDSDSDGYGALESAETACDQPSGTLSSAGDCDDTDAGINPDAAEVCDGIDNDCDGTDDSAGTAAFEDSAGVWLDLTTTLGAGTASSPIDWTLSDDGALWLCSGSWYAAITVTASSASITGRSGAATTTLSGADAEVPITVGAVELSVSGLTVTEGRNTDCGGNIEATGSTLTLSDLSLTDSVADDGGGLCLDGGSAILSDVTLSGGVASTHGGGLYCSDATLAFSSVVFSENDAREEGGGLYLDSCTVSASSLTVSSNTADDEGGGLTMRSSSTLALTGSTFSDNVSGKNGGGLYIKDSTFAVSATTLEGNEASKKGGGLYLDEEDSTISAVTIADNIAEEGAGIYVKDCLLTISDSDLIDNTASNDDGGGMTIEKDGSTEVTDTNWGGNSPDDLYLKHVSDTYSYGPSESFTCDDSECL